MESLTRGRRFEQHGGPPTRTGNPAAAAAGIYRVAYDGVTDVLQVDPDLVGTAGMELEP